MAYVSDFDLEGLLQNVQELQQSVAGSSQRMALEVADAWSNDHLVRVWVNAQGVVIDVEVDEREFADSTPEGVAAAMLQASQAAAATMRDKVARFQADLRQRLTGLLPEAGPPLGDVEALRSVQPDVPTSRPNSGERRARRAALADPDATGPDDDSEGWDLTLRG